MNNKGELMPGGTVARPGKSDKEHLVGSWILISLSAGDGAKETMPYGPNPKDTRWTQRPFFDHAAASDLPRFASDNRMTGTPEENTPIVRGCIAYSGPTASTKRPM